MDLTITAIGINHKTAPVEVRERFACPLKEGEELLFLANIPGVKEVVLLSTCNRVEIYAVCKKELFPEQILNEFLLMKTGGEEAAKEYRKFFFIKTGNSAVEHILSVPAGLVSMVVGETQITKQFKEAFETAKRLGTVGTILNKLYEFALKTAKRVRTETEISKTPVSVSYIAVLLAKKIFGFLEDTKVLVLGAGEMAELTAQYLNRENAQIFVANRTFEKALSLAKKIGANVVRWEDFKNFLKEVDIVIVSTGATDYIITADEIRKLFKRKETPTVFIDISVPRNVEPSIGNLEGVFLYNIDDLKRIAEQNLKERWREAEKGFLIVKEETEKFFKWLENYKLGSVISEINEFLKELKTEILKEAQTPEEALESFSKKLSYPLFKTFKKEPNSAEEFLKNLREVMKKTRKSV
jgi:glutamyl-tRNA reductase